jgi:hypothetical protein
MPHSHDTNKPVSEQGLFALFQTANNTAVMTDLRGAHGIVAGAPGAGGHAPPTHYSSEETGATDDAVLQVNDGKPESERLIWAMARCGSVLPKAARL